MGVGELRIDAGITSKADVVQHQHKVLIHIGRLVLCDDQGALQPALHLFDGLSMGVIPIGARIGQGKVVGEDLSGCDGILRQARDPIHRVFDPNAVPMHRGGLGQGVFDLHPQPFAPAGAQGGAGDASVHPPEIRLSILRRRNLNWRGRQSQAVRGRGGQAHARQ